MESSGVTPSTFYRLDDHDRRIKVVEADTRVATSEITGLVAEQKSIARDVVRIERDGERVDLKVDTVTKELKREFHEEVAALNRRMAWVIASLFLLSLAVIGAAVSIAVA